MFFQCHRSWRDRAAVPRQFVLATTTQSQSTLWGDHRSDLPRFAGSSNIMRPCHPKRLGDRRLDRSLILCLLRIDKHRYHASIPCYSGRDCRVSNWRGSVRGVGRSQSIRRRGDRVTDQGNHPRLLRCTLNFRVGSFSTELVWTKRSLRSAMPPIATEFTRHDESSRSAITGLMQCSKEPGSFRCAACDQQMRPGGTPS